MKILFYSLALLLSLVLSTNTFAQVTSSILPVTSAANPAAYGYDAQSTETKSKLSKRERQRFQRSLARRADDLADWDLQLDDREKALNGRTVRSSRRPLTRNPLPARLLGEDDLYAWESRLDRLADRLRSKDAIVQQRELRVDRHRRYANTRDRHNHQSDRNRDISSCREQCCRPRN